ncbi:MAG TPA: TolC family protein [Polyangiaceae bacterium]|jgi:outer membrane protein TolC
MFFRLSAPAAALLVSLSAAAQEAPPPAAGAPLPHKSLEDCVATALAHNVEVLSAGEEVNVAEAQRTEARGMFGPKLHVDASAQHWNEPYNFQGFPVHDQNVWNVTASATQPITTLLAIYDFYKVKDLGVDVAAVKREAARRVTAAHVIEGYYRLLQAERLVDVAAASVDQLNAQLRQANSFHTNGTVSQDDVLRAQLAVANAQQRLIQGRARVDIDRAQLSVLMGLPPDSAIEADPLPADRPSPRDALSLAQSEKAAETQRVELKEVDTRIALADHETKVAYWKLAPQVNLVGAYIHNEGSLFSQTNAAYVGGTASWDIWDWGTTTGGISEAKARARQAFLARSKVDDQIRLEVRQAFVRVETASEAMDVAKVSMASAEENFRLVKKRYDNSAATSFDVVDAEGLLTQARGQMQTALYDFAIARSALRAAMGYAPEALAK